MTPTHGNLHGRFKPSLEDTVQCIQEKGMEDEDPLDYRAMKSPFKGTYHAL